GAFTETSANTFGGLIVDEAHRLNEKSGLFSNLGENQIKELIHASTFTIFFLDEDQRIHWKDIGDKSQIREWASSLGATVTEMDLESQFRCNGSDGYLAWIDRVLQVRETANTTLEGANYEFKVCDSATELKDVIERRNRVNNKARMAELTGRAFDRALLELGPTQLNIPRDYFYGDIECEIPTPIRIERGTGGENALAQAADLLAQAQFPVILSGGGVVNADAWPEAIALAELLQAPVASSYLHNDAFPAAHPLSVGPLGYQGSKAAMKLIAKADVVLALGTRLGPFGTLPQHGLDYWPKHAKIIQVDADAKMLGLVKPISVGLCGDAKAVAHALAERLRGRALACQANRDARLADVAAERAAWDAELAGWTHERDPWSIEVSKGLSAMHPRQMLRELERAMPARAMVSTDIGNICSVSNSYLRFDAPRSMFAAMSFGNCGYAFPTIVGAKLAAPDRPAIAYVGDGAWGMSFGELQTCVRENIPVTAVVFNNGQWGAEKKNHVDFYDNRFVGVNLDKQPSWAAVARAMGAEGIVVDRV
ncbi:MAG: sulfoacetaldehyde acetyltransferase, partial [Burkholderiaceae bacterium]